MAKSKKAAPTIKAKVIRRVYTFANEDGTESHDYSVVQVIGGQNLTQLTDEVVVAHVSGKGDKKLHLQGVRDFTEEVDVFIPAINEHKAASVAPEFVEE